MTDYDKSLKSIGKHFTETIAPKGVAIINDKPTHWSAIQQEESCIDHITSTHPARMKDVRTIKTTHGDHTILHTVRTSRDNFIAPRYIFTRNYRNIDKLSMAWDLNINPDIRESKSLQEPNLIAMKIQSGIKQVLDKHAPKRVIQTKNQPMVRISQNTRRLQYHAKQLQMEAKITHSPATWMMYRRVRNQVTASLKKDVKNTLRDQLDNKGPSQKWKAARQMAGTKMAGPPTQLVVDGKTITSPPKMAEAINAHYVNKIKSTRQDIGETTSTPHAGLRRVV